MAHSSLAILLLLTFIVGLAYGSHFRGGVIYWDSLDGTKDVTFSVTTYWTLQKFDLSHTFTLGDGSTPKTYILSNNYNTSDYVVVEGTFTYTYAKAGSYMVSYSSCCRQADLRAPAGVGNLGQRLRTQVVINSALHAGSSPRVNLPPVVDFGVGTNALRFSSSYDITSVAFSSSTESGMTFSGTPNVFAGAAGKPTLALVADEANSAILSWKTMAADVGLWPVSITVKSQAYGYIVLDFLISVHNVDVSSGAPTVLIGGDHRYGLTIGQSATFTVGCSSASSSTTYTLSVASKMPGLTINGQEATSVTLTGNQHASVAINTNSNNPYLTNGGTNQQWSLVFICKNNGNSLSAIDSVLISVGIDLTLTPPPIGHIDCYHHCGCIEDVGKATATDGCCGDPVITYKDTPPEDSCNKNFTRTWKATNLCGQKKTVEQTINVNDKTPPVWDPAYLPDLYLQCYAEADPSLLPSPNAADTCSDELTYSITDSEHGTGNCHNAWKRTFSAADNCNNVATVTQKIIVDDSEAPFLQLNTEEQLHVKCPADAEWFNHIVYAVDNCYEDVEITWTDSPAYVVCGKFTRTFYGKDKCGNIGQFSADLSIGHSIPPTITPASYYIPPQCPDVCNVPYPTAKDACGFDLNVELLNTEYYSDYKGCYTRATRNWKATDKCSNIATFLEEIPINDHTHPEFDCHFPPDRTVECYIPTSQYDTTDPYGIDTNGVAVATDNCYKPKVTHSDKTTHGSGCDMIITRTWTATDPCNNTYSKDQIITIRDTVPPPLSDPVPFEGQCPDEIANASKPVIGVDCHKTTLESKDNIVSSGSGKCKNVVINRVWTASDECGNSQSKTQKINITDTTPPVLSVPCDLTIECIDKLDSRCGDAKAKDNCDGPLPHSQITHYDYIFADKVVREWTAVDYCGNWVKKNQTIHLNNSKPFLECPKDAEVPCLSYISPANLGYATVHDECTGGIIPNWTDHKTQDCPTIIERTWTAYNPTTHQTGSCKQTIIVRPPYNLGPFLKLPRDVTVQCPEHAELANTGEACSGARCDEDILSQVTHRDETLGKLCHDYSIRRRFAVHDQCERETYGVQTITVLDNTRPTWKCFPQDCTVTCRYAGGVDVCGSATANDNCVGDVVIKHTDNVIPSENFCPAEIIRTWTATDCSGNTLSSIQRIIIKEAFPEFGYPRTTLDNVSCPDCFHYTSINATGACGEQIKATPVVRKSGICPTTFTVTWTAVDSCQRSSTFVQTGYADDDEAPVIKPGPDDDTTIHLACENDIPLSYALTVRDNCPDAKPASFIEHFEQGNCTCETCTKTLIRVWNAQDKCKNPAQPYTQKIIIKKTEGPTLHMPKNVTLTCGDDETPSDYGTGRAIAYDQCGKKLYVSSSDHVETDYDGTRVIYRTWTTTDDCGNTVTGVQVITIKNVYAFEGPTTAYVPCGGNIDPKFTGKAVGSSKCGSIDIDYTDSVGCPDMGAIQRIWTASRNGVVFASITQTIIYADCPPRATGILYVPKTLVKLADASITPHLNVYDLDIPCETLTITWKWGDGGKDTVTCVGGVDTNPHCKFDAGSRSLDTWYSHTYSAPGVYTIVVIVEGQRNTADVSAADYGDSYAKYSTIYTVVDPYSGSVAGAVELYSDLGDDGYGYAKQKRQAGCYQPWIVKAYNGKTFSWEDVHGCGGIAKLAFSATYKKDGNTTKATGETSMEFLSDTCGGFVFSSTSLDHLSLFADQKSALWTGTGKYSLAPDGSDPLPFTLYAIDGGKSGKVGDFVHFRLYDTKGTVIVDTDPCVVTSPDTWKTQPSQIPNSLMTDGSGLAINNPSDQQISAIGSEDANGSGSVPVGLIVGIVIGLMAFIVIVAIIVYFLLKNSSVAVAASAQKDGKFVAM